MSESSVAAVDFSMIQEVREEVGVEGGTKLLVGLNTEQRAAVLATHGPVLVMAGAGSGKTRVLVTRIAYLIREEGVAPSQILGITFTRKAAHEMRERLQVMLTPDEADGVTLLTFHALGVSLLRDAGGSIGIPPKAGILDDADVAARIRTVLKSCGIRRDAEGETPRQVQERIACAKAALSLWAMKRQRAGESPCEDWVSLYRSGRMEVWEELAEELQAPDLKRFATVYERYQESLFEDKVVDYQDLISLPLLLFLQRPEILRSYQERWHFVTVDEYQDTDFVQDHLLRLLAGERMNLCVVGDDDQSIYSWRGARVENIRTFHKRYPQAATVALEENYRSQPYILEAANALLEERAEAGRLPKKLRTSKARGERLRLWTSYTEGAEAEALATDVQQALESGAIESLDEVMVLYRLNSLSRPLEDAFRAARLPYRIVNGLALHERKEVRDLLAYLRLADNWFDLLSFERAVASPSRGVGPATLEALVGYARRSGISPVEAAMEAADIPGIRGRAAKSLRSFAKLIEELHALSSKVGAAGALHHVLEETGYRHSLIKQLAEAEKEEDVEEAERWTRCLDDVDDFLLYVEEFSRLRSKENRGRSKVGLSEDNLTALLDELATFSPRQERPEVVREEEGEETLPGAATLMSVHSAKGLEAKRVYVVGLEEKTFPAHSREQDGESERMAEEARLFYVAITRAESHLVLSSSLTRELKRGEPTPLVRSRFLAAIPETVYLHQRCE